MHAVFFCLVVTLVALGCMAGSTVSLAASKPSGGICECGQYLEVPVLCRTMTGSELDACLKSNTRWFEQCGAWQDQMCHVSPLVTKSMEPPPAASQPQLFVGSLSGQTKCRSGLKPLTMTVARKPDGSFGAKAFIGRLAFSNETFQGDTVTLLFSSVLNDTTYTGRLVSPNRIEGTISINRDCTWFMTK